MNPPYIAQLGMYGGFGIQIVTSTVKSCHLTAYAVPTGFAEGLHFV